MTDCKRAARKQLAEASNQHFDMSSVVTRQTRYPIWRKICDHSRFAMSGAESRSYKDFSPANPIDFQTPILFCVIRSGFEFFASSNIKNIVAFGKQCPNFGNFFHRPAHPVSMAPSVLFFRRISKIIIFIIDLPICARSATNR